MTDPPPHPIIGVVDDDRRVLESLQNLLESADYRVRLFASAKELLESAELPGIACLISDIDMPGVDGFALLRELGSARPGLPVILITGHAEMLNQSLPIDPSHYQLFKKPFDGHALLVAVDNALRRSAAG